MTHGKVTVHVILLAVPQQKRLMERSTKYDRVVIASFIFGSSLYRCLDSGRRSQRAFIIRAPAALISGFLRTGGLLPFSHPLRLVIFPRVICVVSRTFIKATYPAKIREREKLTYTSGKSDGY